jgi:hypothetical protein
MLLFDCSKVGSRADQMGLSETLTSPSSLLSLLPMSALNLHCGLNSDSAPSPKSAKLGSRAALFDWVAGV